MPTLRSPRYNIELPSGTLAAGDTYYINLADIPECAHEIPYNNVVLRNFSNQRFKIEYGDTKMYVGTSEIFADDTAYGTTSIKITNVTNETQDDILFVVLQRTISTTDAVIAGITGENFHKIANGEV